MEKPKISVVIHTYNEAERLPRVLATVKDFDEVIVCDMESTDATLDIARAAGCRILTFPRGDHRIPEPARNFAIHEASHPWVFVVDADELVPTALRDYLYAHAARADAADGLYISRKSYFMGRWMHGYYPDQQLRFFRRDVTTWPPYVHTRAQVQGRAERIPSARQELAFEHIADFSVRTQVRKINEYTDNEVMKRAAKRYGVGALLWRPFWHFFRSYVVKGGFRDGVAGLVWALLQGCYQTVMVAKTIESRSTAAALTTSAARQTSR